MSRRFKTRGSRTFVSGGGGGNALSDDFSGTTSKWTFDTNSSGFSIVSGVLRFSGSANAIGVARYTNQNTGTLTQYVKATMSYRDLASGLVPFLFRSEATSGYKYILIPDGTGLIWRRYTWDLASSIDVSSVAFSLNNAAPFTMGATIQGLGTSTVIKVWLSPVNNTPVNKDNWDSASDPADYTLTDASSQLGTNNANVGLYVGITPYVGASTAVIDTDNFYGGGLWSLLLEQFYYSLFVL